MQVLITDAPWDDTSIERDALATIGADVVLAEDDDEQSLVDLARESDGIATCWAEVTAAVIEACEDCRIVARMGIGLDNIDIDAATAQGIPVTNVPDYCVEEVADHALALILAQSRHVGFFHLRTKRGDYDLQTAGSMRRLNTQTLGVVGLGRTAQVLACKAVAIGLTVIAHNRSGDDHGTGVEMVSFEELLERSNFISIHAPLTDETEHLFDAQAFEQMKPSAYLVNTSRGGLVDEAALWQALQTDQLAGAALDVFDPEPPDLSQALFADERVIVTPHAAFVSEEAIIDLRERVARQLVEALSGRRPNHVINPNIYDD